MPTPARRPVLAPRLLEILRFASVGGLAFVVDVGVYNLLRVTVLEDKPIGAKVVSVAVAMVVAWIGNRYWTFSDRRRTSAPGELVAFVVANLLGLVIAAACLVVSHYVLGFTSQLADNIAGNGVGLVLGTLFRYVVYRRFVFNRAPRDTTTLAAPATGVRVSLPVR